MLRRLSTKQLLTTGEEVPGESDSEEPVDASEEAPAETDDEAQ